jgi:5-methylcytosine-specific restriction endonuclease McrA
MKLARIERNQYVCAACEGIFPHGDIQVDHIEPVVALTGFENFDVYIERLFCNIEGLQVLCRPCHKIKTDEENAARKLYDKLTDVKDKITIDIDEIFVQYLVDRYGIEKVLEMYADKGFGWE